MRVLLVSSGQFGVPTLRRLAGTLQLVATGPDTSSGRGRKREPTPVKIVARELGLPVLNTADINRPETMERLRAERPEVIVVADFGQILKRAFLEIPTRATINIHPSLLPRYRGAAPIERVILNRERETGVTIILVTEKMDAGPIILQKKTLVRADENAPSLQDRLARQGAEMAWRTLPMLARETAEFTPQEEAHATYAPMITREEGHVSWKESAAEIAARVRALAGRRCAYTFLPDTNTRLLLHEARPVTGTAPPGAEPGTVFPDDARNLLVACGKGLLLVTRLQVAGKNPVSGPAFLRGHPFVLNHVLG